MSYDGDDITIEEYERYPNAQAISLNNPAVAARLRSLRTDDPHNKGHSGSINQQLNFEDIETYL